MSSKRIAFVVFDGMTMLDVSGPAEVFCYASQFGGAYEVTYASASGEPVLTSIGTRFPVDAAVSDLEAVDTVVVAGSDDLPKKPIPPELVTAVQALQDGCRRVVAICTGTFILAAAGLLDGRRVTTHWQHAPLLARAHPALLVVPDALFVRDRGVYTSAGISAGIDLALSLVEEDYGPDVARRVARYLVMFMQRPGGQSQFAAPLEIPAARTPSLRAVVDLVSAQPALDHSTTSLARHAGVSARHLTRLFALELETSPARFVERTRLDHAKALLDSGHGVEETARLVGFGSANTMRRVFLARFGVSPSQYRAQFNRTRAIDTGPAHAAPGP